MIILIEFAEKNTFLPLLGLIFVAPFLFIGIATCGLAYVLREKPLLAAFVYIPVILFEILICICLFYEHHYIAGTIVTILSLISLHPTIMSYLSSLIVVILLLFIIIKSISYLSYLKGFHEFQMVTGASDSLCMSWLEYIFGN
ncbi:MAG: hypothetical protein MST05_09110 [Treponema sp.]|nr:hypothetical protein [Treponema sp.]